MSTQYWWNAITPRKPDSWKGDTLVLHFVHFLLSVTPSDQFRMPFSCRQLRKVFCFYRQPLLLGFVFFRNISVFSNRAFLSVLLRGHCKLPTVFNLLYNWVGFCGWRSICSQALILHFIFAVGLPAALREHGDTPAEVRRPGNESTGCRASR